MAVLLVVLVVVLVRAPKACEGEKAVQPAGVLKELVSLWRRGGVWDPRREQPPPARTKGQRVQTVVRNIMGGLQTLGILPRKGVSLPSLLSASSKTLDRNRLSGFLYNISMYLQGAGGEPGADPYPSDQEQFWENVFYSLMQPEGGATFGQWEGKVPPRPSFRVRDLFLSVRGSRHWDGLLGLIQTILSLSERQPQWRLLSFLKQNWETISALLETILHVLVSGTYGQASAGIQGFICLLKGSNDCGFDLGWLQQLISFLEARNWRPVVNFHPGVANGGQQGGDPPLGRLRPFSMLPGAFQDENLFTNQTQSSSPSPSGLSSVQTLLLQALSRPSSGQRTGQSQEPGPVLLQGLDNLRHGLLHRLGSSVYGSLRRKVSRVTGALLEDVSSVVGMPQVDREGKCSVGDLRQLILWGIRHNLTWNTKDLGFSSQYPPSRPYLMPCSSSKERGTVRSFSRPAGPRRSRAVPLSPEPQNNDQDQAAAHYPPPTEILEAACNESIPGLTGVSNFTVFLYCNLFDGTEEGLDTHAGHEGLDLRATCSDAAWYLSAAEADFLWVHVCSEFFAHEFNNTVCANSSFWVERAHQAAVTKEYLFLNQSSIDSLCVQLSSDASGSPGTSASEDCFVQLGAGSLSAQNFSRCFLPNGSSLIAALCGTDASLPPQGGSWAAEYCSRVHQNSSRFNLTEETCEYQKWEPGSFRNITLLELCRGSKGLREHICHNVSVYRQLVSFPWLVDYCSNVGVNPGDGKCFLQQILDMLPAPYDIDTSQICVNPTPFILDAISRLNQCEGRGDDRVSWLGAVSYVLRALDFVVGLSAGLEEGEREVHRGLGQAILLSSLLDNTSFWATLRPNASLSMLQTVGVFLGKEQNHSLKEDLLSCFSPVLWDLIQREDNSSALRVIFQEYLQMPQESIRTLLMSAENDAVKRFLSHMHQSWNQLQVQTIQVSEREQQAMETMASAFIHKFPRVTPDLFVDLSQFIPFMSISDIMSFPASLLVNDSVLTAIRDHSPEMKSPQKRAFVKRLLQSNVLGDVPAWPPYFLSSILPLLPHLPLCHFQQLTAQQLSPLVEVLGNSSLDATRGRHLLRTVFNEKRDLTSEDVKRLGVLVCYMSPEELRPLLPTQPLARTLRERLALCISEGLTSASGRLSHWLALALQQLSASSLPPAELASLRGLLPQLGASFLRPLPVTQVLDLVGQPGLQPFPPAQAYQVLGEITQKINLSAAGLCRLRPLLPGISPLALRSLAGRGFPGEESCLCQGSLLSELGPALRALLLDSLPVLGNVSESLSPWSRCLVPLLPLRKLPLEGAAVLRDVYLYRQLPWSSQQAQFLFKKILQTTNITGATIANLGRIAGGMSCDWLRLWANQSDFSKLLQLVSGLPGGVRPALRKCVIEELLKRPETDLRILSPEFSSSLPVKMIESLSNASLLAILEHVRQHFTDFLRLSPHKRTALAEKALSVLGISQEGEISGASLDLMGPLFPFLGSAAVGQVERGALRLRLDELKGYCLPPEVLQEIARVLTERDMLGEPALWTLKEMEHAGWLLLALSSQDIGTLPVDLLSLDSVEQVLESLGRWQSSEVGRACDAPRGDREKRDGLVHRVVGGGDRRKREPIPSCADIKGTFPSAWSAAQLSRMEEGEMLQCVEALGQDRELSSEQRRAIWTRMRQAYDHKAIRPEEILQLGCIVTELSERDLQDINLANLRILAHLGAMREWSPKKMRAAALSFLRHSALKVEELGMAELASLGHLLCGLTPSELSRLDPQALSVAALFLRELSLPCSELQSESLSFRLTSPQAFGPVSEWGSEVFTEIGTLAVGLPDIVLSSLVREQIEGLTPAAIALIPPSKLAVVLSIVQLSWLSPEQAEAVTQEQWEELSSEQRLAVALAQYEGELIQEHRGKNWGPPAQSLYSSFVWLLSLCCMLRTLL
nr:PREDICTED: stereocilin-like [Lepisosteus oculatus]